MTRISSRKLNPYIQEKVQEMFWHAIASTKNEAEAKDLIKDLLTTTEMVMLSKRVAVAYLLNKGVSFEEVGEIMKVSTTTVGAVALRIKNKEKGLSKFVFKLEKRRGKEKTIEEILDIFSHPLLFPGLNWSRIQKERFKRKMERQEPF